MCLGLFSFFFLDSKSRSVFYEYRKGRSEPVFGERSLHVYKRSPIGCSNSSIQMTIFPRRMHGITVDNKLQVANLEDGIVRSQELSNTSARVLHVAASAGARTVRNPRAERTLLNVHFPDRRRALPSLHISIHRDTMGSTTLPVALQNKLLGYGRASSAHLSALNLDL